MVDKHVDIFDLKTSSDLFRKAEHDFAAFSKNNDDVYLAFNLFVTLEHLPDWLGQRTLVKKNCILRITSHLANGLKHFQVDDKRHDSVAGTEKDGYVEEGYVEPGYFETPLVIRLTPVEAQDLGVPAIEALELARRVLDFWRPYV